MELKVDEALKKGIEAHKAGKFEEADKFYTAILQTHPKHPDANHNLGVLAVDTGKTKESLPFFKTALEANPKIEQLWLSYIDALIKEKLFETAKHVLADGEKTGLAGKKVDVLQAQLSQITQTKDANLPEQKTRLTFAEKRKEASAKKKKKRQNANSLRPSQQQLSILVQHYQNRQYDEAEKLAISITEQFPNNELSWKVLGAVFWQTGRMSEALGVNQKAVALTPKNAEAHYNLGTTLQELGRLEEAEASYRKAIALKPGLVEAYRNLGKTLQELNRLEESEASYRQAIAMKPDYAKAHYNLGTTLQELGRLEEAEASYREAIALKPGLVEAHSNLGTTLKELGRLKDAEASYRKAITAKPDYAEAHYNLGNALQELGRLEEAEASYRKAIALKPGLVEAYRNLGKTLQGLNRLEESEASYRQAIAMKPDYAKAHYNLGTTLQELGRLEEAEASYRQAIALKPGLVEAHNNLGITLRELNRLEESEASYRQAIAMKPDYADAHSNLGVTLQELGRLEEAEASYRKAIALKSDYAEAMLKLSIVQDYMNNLDEAILQLENILKIDVGNCGLKAAINLAIFRFLEGDFTTSKMHLLASSKIQKLLDFEFNNFRVYQEYLLKILSWHENKSPDSIDFITDKKLYVIGESHALISHQLRVQRSGSDFLCKSFLIQGCMQWNLGNSIRNQYKTKFEGIIRSLPNSSEILLAIGEIDCRLDSGIIKHRSKYPQKNIKELIATTIENYFYYIDTVNSCYGHKIIIQGVPCPNIGQKNIAKEKVMELIDVIRGFNVELKSKSKKMGFDFLDLYKLTDRGDGFSNNIWHLDQYHLSAEGMHEAWREYSFDSSPTITFQ